MENDIKFIGTDLQVWHKLFTQLYTSNNNIINVFVLRRNKVINITLQAITLQSSCTQIYKFGTNFHSSIYKWKFESLMHL